MLIKVLSGLDSGKELLLYPGQQYHIGRDPAFCQLRLKDPQVSRIHAIVQIDEFGRLIVTDNGSQNGTYSSGSRITKPTEISTGRTFEIGNTVLVAEQPSKEHRSRTEAANLKWQATKSEPARIGAPGDVITIGRDPGNTITLPHPHVSRTHAIIETTVEGTYITDLKSTNGTFVDGVRIAGKHALNAQSVIRINGFRLTMEDFAVVKHDETGGQVTIDVRDLSKVVTLIDGNERVLLNNLNFRIEPREFVAILGGSGAGKTTLLKAMMGTWPATFGELLINGTNYYEEYSAFKAMIGYVPQDDIVHLDLTVEEVLNYAARLRMPDDTSTQERNMRIEQVVQDLGLTERRSLLVKDLSGGQRKRVSIGVELITMPSIMFLDEPTSGLDPGLEKIMMEMMRNMANQGQTIILVTHATFNIHLCDKLVFLTEGGRLAFFGSPQEALAYFGTDDFAEIYKMINVDRCPEDWQYSYSVSEYAAKYQPRGRSGNAQGSLIDQGTNKISSLKQWYDLSSRYARTVLRDRKNLLIMLLQPIIMAALLCLVFLSATPVFEKTTLSAADVEVTEQTIIEGRLAEVNINITAEAERKRNITFIILATVLSAIWSGSSNSAREIVKETFIYKRERFVNVRITPYLMSKIVVLAVLCLIQAVFFISIITVVLGFPSFLLNVLAFFLIAISSALMGLTISALSANANVATSILPILLIPQFIFAGAIVPIEAVEPEFLQSLFYVVVGKWGYELVGGGICDINSLLAFAEPISALEGSFTLHWWILGLFCLVFYIIAALAMLRKDQDLS
jgi:ABC transport system ATP-binding/permease protein